MLLLFVGGGCGYGCLLIPKLALQICNQAVSARLGKFLLQEGEEPGYLIWRQGRWTPSAVNHLRAVQEDIVQQPIRVDNARRKPSEQEAAMVPPPTRTSR